MKILLIFIDGFGIGSTDPKRNPILAAKTPTLDWLFSEEESIVIPTDASQGVKGIPQSATGQTALLTGVQASQALGHHQSGFPGPTLRSIIAEKNILKQMQTIGKKATFANAYTRQYVVDVFNGKTPASVTTVCVMESEDEFRYTEQILSGDAVYQDFTNQILIEWGEDVPKISPEEAGGNLAKIVKGYDFTLYEYFQTDIIGHSQNWERAIVLIEQLDRFLRQVFTDVDLKETLVLISSDHGNIEDLSTNTHTCNPVPTILVGAGREQLKDKIKELADITPALISYVTQ